MSFRIINGKIVPVEALQEKKSTSPVEKENFNKVFETELEKENQVKISKHAMERIKTRNIELDGKDLKKLTDAIDKADSKGARESLLLYKDVAFIASIRNKTIITAVDGQNAKDNIFTNIDSAVIIS
ncbi:MAG TPA: flagellar biosynthesis protein [Clostridiaceae bacterium]|nr:flagellar biosynthesis protein [Clostridiaceae bacterium]